MKHHTKLLIELQVGKRCEKTIHKIYKPPTITVCGVIDKQNLVTNLTCEKSPVHE